MPLNLRMALYLIQNSSYINSLSSNAQTQIDAKAAVGTANTWTAGQRGEITALTSATSVTLTWLTLITSHALWHITLPLIIL